MSQPRPPPVYSLPLHSPLPGTHVETHATRVLCDWLLLLGITFARFIRVGHVFSASLRLTTE